MPNNKIFTINSLKFDGLIDKTWKVQLTAQNDDLLTFVGVFENEFNHSHLGVIRRGTVSYEFYWKNRWYNIFRFHEPEGDFRNFYCNINCPPEFKNNVLSYIDLDVDVLVRKDLSFVILDTEEFEINAVKFGYSKELRQKVNENLSRVIQLINDKKFPFDFSDSAKKTMLNLTDW